MKRPVDVHNAARIERGGWEREDCCEPCESSSSSDSSSSGSSSSEPSSSDSSSSGSSSGSNAPAFAAENLAAQSFWDVDSPANHLTWFAHSGEPQPPTGYRVYRRASGDAQDTLLATLGTVLSHVDLGPIAGVAYIYTVIPFTAGGDGPAATIQVTTVNGP
jgi:hypothetical protein